MCFHLLCIAMLRMSSQSHACASMVNLHGQSAFASLAKVIDITNFRVHEVAKETKTG